MVTYKSSNIIHEILETENNNAVRFIFNLRTHNRIKITHDNSKYKVVLSL